MFKKVKNIFFAMSLLLMQSFYLFTAAKGHYSHDMQQAHIAYKVLPTESEQAREWSEAQVSSAKFKEIAIEKLKKISGSKDDSFLPSSKSTIATKYKKQGLTLEDRPKDITEVGSDKSVPTAVVEPIDENIANSGLLDYSGLTHVTAEPIHATAIAEAHAVTGSESYDAQGNTTRKDFVDADGKKHHIIYESGAEIENIIGENGFKEKEIITQKGKISETRLYKYNVNTKKNVLQSIETKLPDGKTVFKHVYSGKMIDAQVRNKSGEVEGTTHRDDFDVISTTVAGEDRPNRVATDSDLDGIAPENVTYNADGSTETVSFDATGVGTSLFYNTSGHLTMKAITQVDGSEKFYLYNESNKIYQVAIYNAMGEEESNEDYNELGKMISKTVFHENGHDDIEYYDNDGNVVSTSLGNVE